MNDFSKLSAEDDISRLAQISSEEIREVGGETNNQEKTDMHAKLCEWLTECKCHETHVLTMRKNCVKLLAMNSSKN
jgi:hypothetical protein